MIARVQEAADSLASVRDNARVPFSGLNVEQLNWRRAEKSWSVAQCFDHLITTHSLYFPLFEKLATGTAQTSIWERVSPLSGFFGRFLIKSLRPENPKKMKTTAKAHPAASNMDGDIIERFCRHQDEMIGHLQALPDTIDPKRIITSPLLGIVTYSLADTFTILSVHCERHFLQAKRVTEAEGFPGP